MSTVPRIEAIAGFQLAAVKAGLKKSGNLDLGLIVADAPAAAGGVFTKSKVVSPAVTLCRKHLKSSGGRCRAVLVNAGIANACTGAEGRKNALATAKAVGKLIGSAPSEVLVCSTGVIGHQLPMPKMLTGIEAVAAGLGRGQTGDFGRAIMTTDLKPKAAGLDAGGFRLAGVCKGSGMIAPNMATMLAFMLTDAKVAPAVLTAALREAADETFNCVTVDGDTSTNDSLILLASGRAGGAELAETSGQGYRDFVSALRQVAGSLAEQIAADGEGATKLVRINLKGAASQADARRAARIVAESPLVKTALFGNDPNWGRIVAALGRSGARMQEAKTTVALCGTTIFRLGAPVDFNAPELSGRMKAPAVDLDIDLGLGAGECRFLTCDLSYEYVKINAEYHT